MDATAEVLRHLRAHLGEVAHRWKALADGRPMRFEVLAFQGKPFRGATTFVTLGLSAQSFALQRADRAREELVMSVWDRFAEHDVPGLLHHLAVGIADRDTAVLRGQVIGPSGPIFPGSQLSAIYFTPPPYFPETFDYLPSTVPPTLLVGVVPVWSSEVEIISEIGWSRFEDSLAHQNPDLLDLDRGPIARLH